MTKIEDAIRDYIGADGTASIEELTTHCAEQGVCSSRATVKKYLDQMPDAEAIPGRPVRYHLKAGHPQTDATKRMIALVLSILAEGPIQWNKILYHPRFDFSLERELRAEGSRLFDVLYDLKAQSKIAVVHGEGWSNDTVILSNETLTKSLNRLYDKDFEIMALQQQLAELQGAAA